MRRKGEGRVFKTPFCTFRVLFTFRKSTCKIIVQVREERGRKKEKNNFSFSVFLNRGKGSTTKKTQRVYNTRDLSALSTNGGEK